MRRLVKGCCVFWRRLAGRSILQRDSLASGKSDDVRTWLVEARCDQGCDIVTVTLFGIFVFANQNANYGASDQVVRIPHLQEPRAPRPLSRHDHQRAQGPHRAKYLTTNAGIKAWKGYANVSCDTLKLYFNAHGTKTQNLIINMDDTPFLQDELSLQDSGIGI